MRSSGQQVLDPRGAPWQHKRRLPPLESVLAWCISQHKGGASFLRLLTRWEEHSSQLCFHTGALAIPQMLFIKQAALDVTTGYSVTGSDWGDPFCSKCCILTAKEPTPTTPHVHRKSYTATSASAQHFLIHPKTIGFLKCCCLVSTLLSASN